MGPPGLPGSTPLDRPGRPANCVPAELPVLLQFLFLFAIFRHHDKVLLKATLDLSCQSSDSHFGAAEGPPPTFRARFSGAGHWTPCGDFPQPIFLPPSPAAVLNCRSYSPLEQTTFQSFLSEGLPGVLLAPFIILFELCPLFSPPRSFSIYSPRW